MTEKDILDLIAQDGWMMKVLSIAEELNFPDWAIGAGFVRNKVWDHLHGYHHQGVDTHDIDLVYYEPAGNEQRADEELSEKLRVETGLKWEVVNQAYAHRWNDLPPYHSTEDALSKWPETATGVGVRLKRDRLKLVVPHGLDDLVNLVIRPAPNFQGGMEQVKARAEEKQWLDKWPKLKFSSEN